MNEEIYQYLLKIIAARANPENGRDSAARMAYCSCMWMLEYAHNGDWEALRNFDYGERPALSGQMIKMMFR